MTLTETRRVVHRAEREGRVTSAQAADLRTIFAQAASTWAVLEISDEVARRAETGFPIEPVRTLDAIHLASALFLREALPDLAIVTMCDATGACVIIPGPISWYRRLLTHPHVELVCGGATPTRVARPDPSPPTQLAVYQAFAARYGLVDFWYGAILRRGPIPIRLDPATAGGELHAGPRSGVGPRRARGHGPFVVSVPRVRACGLRPTVKWSKT